MRRAWLRALLIAAVAVAPLAAIATIQKPAKTTGATPGKIIPNEAPSVLLLHAPFNSVGGQIPEDANTISHVTFDPWRTRTDPAAVGSPKPIEQERAVAWNGALFVASGNTNGGNPDSYMITSSDGVTWTLRNIGTHVAGFTSYGMLGWNGTIFTAICDAACSSRQTATSTDGITWTVGPINGLTGFQPHTRPVWNGSIWAIAGLTGTVAASSTDGATWTNRTIPSGGYNGLAWGNGTFVAVGNSGVVSTSADGITWASQTPPTASNFFAIEHNGSTFAAVGASIAATSTDGVTWVMRTIPAGTYLHIGWNGTYFLAVGSNVAATSTDGITWTARSAPGAFNAATSLGGNGLAWNGSTWVAVTGNTADPRILTGTTQQALALPGALLDSKGNVWAQNGTVPTVTSTPLYPDGFSAAAKPGAGAFSDANFYSLGSGSDVLDFAGDFSACLAYSEISGANSPVLFSNGTNVVDGYYIQNASVGVDTSISFSTTGVASRVVDATATPVLGPNVVCSGRAGSTGYLKANLRTAVTGTAGTITAATTTPARIGRYPSTLFALNGNEYELWFSTTTPTDALFTSIQNRFFGHVAATGQTLTVTRATTATAEPKAGEAPSLYTWPTNILRITENGVLLEAGATNYVLRSAELDNAAWTSTTTVTANQYVAPDGLTTAEKVASTVNTQTTQQAVTSASSTVQTASAWVRSDTGTVAMTVGVDHATVAPTACTCTVSSGTCTTGTSVNKCFAYSTVGTAFVRLAATATYAAAQTAMIPFVTAGQFGTSTGTGGVWGVQLENGSYGYASSYVPTTTATVARNADVVTVANPLPVGPFCVTGTWTPALAPLAAWATADRGFWIFGTAGAANSARAQAIADVVRFQIIDSAGTSKFWDTPAVLSGSSASKITACSDNAGNVSVTVNGAAQSLASTGAGTAILTAMGAVTLNDGTLSPVAALKDFKICKSATPAKCQ